MNDFLTVNLKPTCLSLRHKLMYCDERHSRPGMVDANSDTRVYMCSETGEPLGPDRQLVHPSECKAGRACFCSGVPRTPSESDPAGAVQPGGMA
jgi:hypothetical protein